MTESEILGMVLCKLLEYHEITKLPFPVDNKPIKIITELTRTLVSRHRKEIVEARIEENELYLKKDSWYTAEKRIAQLKKAVHERSKR